MLSVKNVVQHITSGKETVLLFLTYKTNKDLTHAVDSFSESGCGERKKEKSVRP